METNYLGRKKGKVGIEVIDENESMHTVEVGLDGGEIIFHGTDDYPHKRDDRTLEQQKIMTQVEKRAKFAAQQEFPDADILDPEWNPGEVRRAIEAIGQMDVEAFAREFDTCYRMVTEPTSFEGVTAENVQMIHQPLYIGDDTTVSFVPRPAIQYKTGDGATVTDLDDRVNHQDGAKIKIALPPLEFDDGAYEFPDGFQVFIIEHLHAQIRDLYRHMGETPPEQYADMDEDFPGLAVHAGHDEYYDDF